MINALIFVVSSIWEELRKDEFDSFRLEKVKTIEPINTISNNLFA